MRDGAGLAIRADMETKTGRIVDISNVSDTVLDAVLALRSNDTSFDFDALTRRELIEVQEISGVSLALWIAGTPEQERAARSPGADFEAMILARQEDDGRNVG